MPSDLTAQTARPRSLSPQNVVFKDTPTPFFMYPQTPAAARRQAPMPGATPIGDATPFQQSLDTTRQTEATAKAQTEERSADENSLYSHLTPEGRSGFAPKSGAASLNGVPDDNTEGITKQNFRDQFAAELKAGTADDFANRLTPGATGYQARYDKITEAPASSPSDSLTPDTPAVEIAKLNITSREKIAAGALKAKEPGALDYLKEFGTLAGKFIGGIKDAGLRASAQAETKRHNDEMEKIAKQNADTAKARADKPPAQGAAAGKLTQQSYLSRSKAIIDGYPRSQQKALLARLDEEFKAAGGTPINRGTGNGPSADPANSGTRPVDAAPTTQPTTQPTHTATANDGSGRKIQFNTETKQWEPVQ